MGCGNLPPVPAFPEPKPQGKLESLTSAGVYHVSVCRGVFPHRSHHCRPVIPLNEQVFEIYAKTAIDEWIDARKGYEFAM
jgi:hypothetical protein